jgi:hypothetical protein
LVVRLSSVQTRAGLQPRKSPARIVASLRRPPLPHCLLACLTSDLVGSL